MINKFKKLFLDITEKEYRAYDAISYSMLSSFDKKGPLSIVAKKKEVEAFRMGNLVETLLLEENLFNEKFFLFNGYQPTATLFELCKILSSSEKLYTLNMKDEILDIIFENNLWNSIKDKNKLIAKFDNDNFYKYLEAQYMSNKGIDIIDASMFAKAMEKVTALRNHEYTASIISEEAMSNSIIQAKAVVSMNDIPIKSMFDIITVDFENKIIYPRDLKTGKELAEDFDRNFYAYRYYIQGGLYSKVLEILIKETEFENYTIAPFEFIYINNANQNSPIIKRMEEGWNKIAANGWSNSFNYKSRGYLELIDLYLWHKCEEEYNYSKETVENNGVSIIKLPT